MQSGWRNVIKVYLKVFLVSVCSTIIVAVCSIIYGFIAHRLFTLRYIFDANFLVGVILIVVGIVIMFLPSAVFTKTGEAVEKFTLMQRSFQNRENKQQKARIILWLGIFIFLITGLIQILLSWIM